MLSRIVLSTWTYFALWLPIFPWVFVLLENCNVDIHNERKNHLIDRLLLKCWLVVCILHISSDLWQIFWLCAEVSISNHSLLAQFCKDHHVGLVVVGPEVPLAAGEPPLLLIFLIVSYCVDRSLGLSCAQVLWTTWRQLAFPALAPRLKPPSWRRAKASPRLSWSATASRQPATAPSPTPRRPATTSARQCSQLVFETFFVCNNNQKFRLILWISTFLFHFKCYLNGRLSLKASKL